MSRRVELLPQSKAASASVTNVNVLKRADLERLGDELPYGVVSAREVVREMSVKALHPHSRSPDAAVGLDEVGRTVAAVRRLAYSSCARWRSTASTSSSKR